MFTFGQRGCSCNKVIGIIVALTCFVNIATSFSTPANQPDEEAVLKVLVERFFDAYAKKDLDGFMRLWSEKSPNYESLRKAMQQVFAKADYAFPNLTIKQIQVEGEKARLRILVTLTEIDPKTKAQFTARLDYIFSCIKEADGWKIWRCYPTAEELAIALINAATDEEREKLLEKESELVTIGLVQSLLVLGDQQYRRNNPKNALAVYRLAQNIAQRIGSMEGIAQSRNREGNALALMGQLREAMEAYEESINLLQAFIEQLQKAGEQERVNRALRLKAALLHNLGNFYQVQIGDPYRALAKYQEELALSRKIGDRFLEAGALNNIGGLHISFGKFVQGIKEMEEAVRIYEELLQQNPDPETYKWYLITLNHLAAAYSSFRFFPQSLERYQKSLKVSREIGDKVGEMGALWGIGIIYDGQGDFKKAIEYFEQSLKIAQEEEHYGWVVTNLGSLVGVYKRLGDYDKALTYAQEHLKVARQAHSVVWEAAALSLIASILVNKGDLVQARTYAEEAVKKAEEFGLPRELIYALMGNLYKAEKQWAQAVDAYRQYLTYVEQKFPFEADPQTKLIHLERSWSEVYNDLAFCLLMLDRHEEALQVLERTKARVLTEILRKGKVDITKAMTDEEREKERELSERIVSLNAELRALRSQKQPDPTRLSELSDELRVARQEYDAFRRSLYLRHPELAVKRGENPPLTAAQIFQWLQSVKAQNLVVLEYFVHDERTWVFVLQKTGTLKVYPIDITRKELEQRVDALRTAIRKREEGKVGALLEIEKALRRLDILVSPIEPLLANAQQICIVPDDVLWEVPFAALKTSKGRYLVELSAVSYAPSITALKTMQEARKRTKPANTLLAFAPFAYTGGNEQTVRTVPLRGAFGALPASLREVSALAKLYGIHPYLRDEAKESRAKAEGRKTRILHFATHALFEPSHGMYSGIVLAEEEGEDGFLEAREIVDLDLQADLAVLSACETARGEIHRGEGLIGLSWAFFVAGCASTVVSQWKVLDESTAELMATFYRNLKAGKNKAEALRQAQLHLLRNRRYSHPFFWSPFILIGDWQ